MDKTRVIKKLRGLVDFPPGTVQKDKNSNSFPNHKQPIALPKNIYLPLNLIQVVLIRTTTIFILLFA